MHRVSQRQMQSKYSQTHSGYSREQNVGGRNTCIESTALAGTTSNPRLKPRARAEKLLTVVLRFNYGYSQMPNLLLAVCGLFFINLNVLAQETFPKKLSAAAIGLTKQKVSYDPSYFSIPYPNGDVPADKGVCTDVVIRAYRKLSIDLQRLVHEDMKANFKKYPNRWGLTKTDRNIDHRRVPNLMTFFTRHGTSLPTSKKPEDYKPGDIVTWDLSSGVPHIGIIIDKKSDDGLRYLIVHNNGSGQEISDCLFQFKITGHFRFAQ
jgi:uncharacterized protein YijF (DUF1287 family)